MATSSLDVHLERLRLASGVQIHGKIADVVGLTVEATGPAMNVGDICHVMPPSGGMPVPVEVVGFRGGRILLMPLGDITGVGPKSRLVPTFKPMTIRTGRDLIGRVIGGLGNPIDGGPKIRGESEAKLVSPAPAPMSRRRIAEPIATGVRAIDGCITCGKGQRIGVMSGSGVGKSKLIGMIARNTNADVNVIALIGERGREVRDFVESDLGEEGLRRSVVVAATSDEPALVRIKGAYTATAIAEWFRSQGADVMLIMDSVTRFAMAQREVGLAVGEPPTTRGYPPSVFSLLPKLLERAGTTQEGSITGFYSVLVEADDLNDPIGDAVRGILDGHIALSRPLATSGHYPAIDVLESISRVMIDVVDDPHMGAAQNLRRMLATYRDAEDLINIGAYVKGNNPDIDAAIRVMPKIREFLRQGLREQGALELVEKQMKKALA